MKLEDLKTIGQLSEFLSGTQVVAFSIILDKHHIARHLRSLNGYSYQAFHQLAAQFDYI